MSSQIHHLQVGEIACTVLGDGVSQMNPDSLQRFFSDVPFEQVRAAYVDMGMDINNLNNAFNCLYIRTADEQILVDTGFGMGRQEGFGNVVPQLAEMGVQPEDITTVLITHAHGDHIMGLVTTDDKPQFPNARVLFNSVEWDYWYTENNLGEQGKAILDKVAGRVETFSIGDEIAPGVATLEAYGHTPGHTALRIESNGETLLHLVDVLHRHVQFAHPQWSPPFDSDTSLSVPTRKKWMAQAAEDGTLVLFYHLTFPGLGHIHKEGDSFKWVPIASQGAAHPLG